MKNLKDLLYKVAIDAVKGSTDVAVNELVFDSRKVGLNDVFIAINGAKSNGHAFIDAAVKSGAHVVICESFPNNIINEVTYIKVENSSSAFAQMASNFYDNPSSKLKLVGVTGTNGKTTIATLLYQMFSLAGYPVGLLSTVVIKVGSKEHKATHTTPDVGVINHFLNEMVLAGCEFCFMEVSSHGIAQKRTEGLEFEGGIFTNLSHDHLDYHASFAEYRDVKKSFFDNLPKKAFALTNIDDKNGNVMLQNTSARIRSYAVKSIADYKAIVLENQLSGLVLKIDNQEVYTQLIGNFNAYNLLAIYGTAIELGMDKNEALQYLSQLNSVAGRFQYVISDSKITAIVDYAHTPDALENVLSTVNSIRTNNEQLITVVGCGGDRDVTKRPLMAKIAAELSTKVVLTSDNPRTENPDAIIEEMEKGVEPQNFNKTVSVSLRKQAIKTACQLANPNDIIVIAGKGHETYQEINGVRHHFDDMETVIEMLKQLNK